MSAKPRQRKLSWPDRIVDVAKSCLKKDRDATIVVWSPNGTISACDVTYSIPKPKPNQMPAVTRRPYMAQATKVAGENNGYLVVRYGDEVVVWAGADTVLYRKTIKRPK